MRRTVIDDDFKICLLPYKNESLKEVIGFDGFIDPDGKFYKVCESGELSYVHDTFVEIFTEIKYGYGHLDKMISKSRCNIDNMSNKDVFIHLYGYVNVQISNGKIELGIPERKYLGNEVTDRQIDTILNLMRYNNIPYYNNGISNLLFLDEDYNNKCSSLYYELRSS